MRLLNVYQLELKTFDHRKAPPYAILSHTWGDEEVDYQTLISKPQVKNGRGWSKILGTCKKAIQDNYDWVWIDTCNIDKSSSAELSEAINSMFVWYQASSVCYAFLEDLHVNDTSQELDLYKLLKPARWFTRGWTLQELIAPQNVVLYSASWQLLGTKSLLYPTLAEITGVDERVLQNPAMLSTMSIAQRMSWAAQRQTTRAEDVAYCLLGIFNVNIPLLYGEGGRAFLRLQEELINRFDDQTIFAWSLFEPLAPDTGKRDDRAWECQLGGGVIAPHPLAFKNSSHIVPVARLDLASEPTAITTRGILIEANLIATQSPTIYAWLLPCSSTSHPDSVVAIQLRTPSSRTKRYSRVATTTDFICYVNEMHLTNLSYQRVYLKRAVEHNPCPTSRICHLRSYPSHLLKPIGGLVIDLDKPTDGPFLSIFHGVLPNGRQWNQDCWTADLGTSHLHNGVALIFKFVPSCDQSKYLAVTMTIPGSEQLMLTRHRTVDGNSPLDQILKDYYFSSNVKPPQDSIWIPEINDGISVKVDVEIEHGGVIYVFDIHFEPIKGQGDRFIHWKEEGEKEQIFADFNVELNVPEEDLLELQDYVERGEVGLVRKPSLFLDSP